MGIAVDSFVLTIEYAGVVTLILLVLCLVSRHKNNSGNLNVFQRMPVLLPAVGFIITIILVANAGLTPISQYQGVNSRLLFVNSGDTVSFSLREQEMYSEAFQIWGSYQLEYNDSMYVEVFVSQNGSLIDSLTLDIQYSLTSYVSSGQDSITLEPGSYNIQVNFTKFEAGVPEEDQGALQLTISQPLVAGMTKELADWGAAQFTLNMFSILMILGGLAIGSSTKKPPKEDETDWKTSTEYEY
ncbi:MAG: hypothetical protein E4H14_02235 [Candidatus Thorarchaeota archaeon]|nr:MAG: hypothetical protein E4H14_02235 [Candidatus Thorarchaeota archaeon]